MRLLLIALSLLFTVSAYGQYPITATPQRIDLGQVAIGSTDSAVAVLTNNTFFAVTGLQFEIDGPDASSFSVFAPIIEVIPGSSQTILISFTCLRAGAHEARILIRGYTGTDTTRQVRGFIYLGATGDGSTAGITPFYQAVTFGGVAPGESQRRTFTLSNSSTTDITVGLKSSVDGGATLVDFTSSVFSLEDQGGESMPRTITIGAGNTVLIDAIFSPTSLDNVSDSIFLVWGGRVTHVALYGYGAVAPDLTIIWAHSFADSTSVSTQPGDFVADSIGGTDVWTARVHNNTTEPRIISVAKSVIAMPSPFSVPVNVAPITIPPAGYVDIDIIYTGHGPDPFIDTLVFLNELGMPFDGARLVGYVRPRPSVRVWVGNISGKPGETDSLEITVASSVPMEATQAQLTLSFNASVLIPQFPVSYDETSNGMRTVVTTVDVPGHDAGTLLAALPFMIALGDQTVSEVTLPSVLWLDASGSVLPISTESGDGTTTVEDDRTVNANGGSIGMKLSPSPAVTTLNVEYTGVDGDVTVDLYDLTGVRLLSIPGTSSGGSGNSQLNVSPLAHGIYAVRVSDRSHSLVRRIIIE
ncbi:MAG: T9SS type A sorting domain-containing protein [Ignavibacteria bacterium]|nr:T9SS type A sorting domain-containing protein [Ignavibacteria bacterium]